MSKRPRASLLLTPAFAGMGLSAQEKDQHFLAFIPIPNAVRNLLFPFLYLSSSTSLIGDPVSLSWVFTFPLLCKDGNFFRRGKSWEGEAFACPHLGMCRYR